MFSFLNGFESIGITLLLVVNSIKSEMFPKSNNNHMTHMRLMYSSCDTDISATAAINLTLSYVETIDLSQVAINLNHQL